MASLRELHLFHEGPVPAAERLCARLGDGASFGAVTARAEERWLESMIQCAARSSAFSRADIIGLQDELKRFRAMALASRERWPTSQQR